VRNTQELYRKWMDFEPMQGELKVDLKSVEDDPEQINDRFYRSLSFGTGGLRGKMGAGTNRMNVYTVAKTSRGLAKYLAAMSDLPSCAIAYDSRNNSALFARVSAAALAQAGVRVHLFAQLAPTPMCSFAVRYFKCEVGVVITASHNPAEYNGYKVYDKHGGQITDDAAAKLSGLIAQQKDLVREFPDYEALLRKGMIRLIERDVWDAYQEAVLALSIQAPTFPLHVVYSPLNGTGNRPVRQMLSNLPLVQVSVVPQQEMPDGNFPTCPKPNPENPQAMALAARLMEDIGADICLATDPDCDRLGVGVRTKEGTRFLSGNEIGVLLLHFICEGRLAKGTMPDNAVVIKTIVTAPMVQAIARHYNLQVVNVLTGFKYIGDAMNRLKREGQIDRFIFAFEESLGYLSGTHVREKDAVNAALLVCEMAAHYASQRMTLLDAYRALEARFGVYLSGLCTFVFEGEEGAQTIARVMAALRRAGSVAGHEVLSRVDYLVDATGLPPSDVLSFTLAGERQLIARPSGTEPILKLYLSVQQGEGEDGAHKLEVLDQAARQMIASMQ
jgi:phosphoglucomutase